MTLPAQPISSGPTRTFAAPFATSPPLIVDPHAMSIPPVLTCTPPDMVAPPSRQKSPALMTTPPTMVPESGTALGGGPVLHSVAASAPSLPTANAKPTIPARKPASVFIVEPPLRFRNFPRHVGTEWSVAECLFVCLASTTTGGSNRRAQAYLRAG